MENKKVYVYEDLSGFDIILRSSEISEDKLYDPVCDEYYKLLLVTSDVRELESLLIKYGFSANMYNYFTRAFEEVQIGKIDSTEIE